MKSQTLSYTTGLANKETVVSRLIAAAFNEDPQSPFLDALRSSREQPTLSESGLEVLGAFPEFTFGKNRLDVLAVLKGKDSLQIAVVEVKVSAHEGNDQLARYGRDIEGNLLRNRVIEQLKRVGYDGPFPTEDSIRSDLYYLTVNRQIVSRSDNRVKALTFTDWYQNLANVEWSTTKRSLTAWLLEDVITYLGRDHQLEIDRLEALSADTPSREIRDLLQNDDVLQKEILRRTCQVIEDCVREIAPEMKTGVYDSHGCPEFGLQASGWEERTGRRFSIKLVRSINADLFQTMRPKANVSFLPSPYKSAKKLGADHARANDRRRLELLHELRRSFSVKEIPPFDISGEDKYWEPGHNSILKILEFPIAVGPDTSLQQIADQIVAAARKVDEYIRPIVKQLDDQAG